MINKLISLAILTFFLLIGYSYSETQFLYPKKKPSIFKPIDETSEQKIQSNLPQKKPKIQSDNTKGKQVLNEEKKIENKEVKVKDEQLIKTEEKKIKVGFVYPKKKPSIYRSKTKEIKASSILKQKDFEQAKKTIDFIKQKKWNSALKSAAKVKDKDFSTLITWMHLKTTRYVA